MIGHEKFGAGDRGVFVLNDWLGDTSTWDAVRPYLDRRRFTCADPEAVAAYVAMFARDGLPDPDAPVDVPLLAITGEKDAEPMRHDAVKAALAPLAGRLSVVPLADSGHYPMQEAPPLLATLVGRFLSGEG